MKPYIIKSRSFSNSDARNFAKAVLGKPVEPKPAEPEFKPELVVTPPFVEESESFEEQVQEVTEEPVVDATPEVQPEAADEAPVEEQPNTADEDTEEEQVETVTGTELSELGLSASNIKNLKVNNINTVEELEAFVNSGEQLAALPKIGVKAEQAIIEALTTWKEQNQK